MLVAFCDYISGYVGGFMGREMDRRGFLWNHPIFMLVALYVDMLPRTPFISKDLKIWL